MSAITRRATLLTILLVTTTFLVLGGRGLDASQDKPAKPATVTLLISGMT